MMEKNDQKGYTRQPVLAGWLMRLFCFSRFGCGLPTATAAAGAFLFA